MSNGKKMPVAEKSAAGKSNLKQNSSAKKKNNDEKNARKIVSGLQKERERLEKQSRRVQGERQKQKARSEKKQVKREFCVLVRKKLGKVRTGFDKLRKRLGYYFSREFLSSLNYVRIFLCLVLPFLILTAGIISFSKSTFATVPSAVRNFEFEGGMTDERNSAAVNHTDVFRRVQMFGLAKIKLRDNECYINRSIHSGDDFICNDIYFENPSDNDCVMILTLIDEKKRVIYRSLGVKPGTELTEIQLFDGVSYGTHEIIACVNAYNPETMKRISAKHITARLDIGNVQ